MLVYLHYNPISDVTTKITNERTGYRLLKSRDGIVQENKVYSTLNEAYKAAL